MYNEESYLCLLSDTLANGEYRTTRTGIKTLSLFGTNMEFDLQESFPLLTTKRVSFYNIAHELLWFLSGSTNVWHLQQKGVHIWDEWADEHGRLGHIYGEQWRSWNPDPEYGDSIDQITNLIEGLKNDPYGRRHLVTAWNPSDMSGTPLPPCHVLFQMYVDCKQRLSCQVYQRSADMFLGVPYNIASYALLTHIIASICGYIPGKLVWVGGDTHIYENHVEQVQEQLSRVPRPGPKLYLRQQHNNIAQYSFTDFNLIQYDPHPAIKGRVAV